MKYPQNESDFHDAWEQAKGEASALKKVLAMANRGISLNDTIGRLREMEYEAHRKIAGFEKVDERRRKQ